MIRDGRIPTPAAQQLQKRLERDHLGEPWQPLHNAAEPIGAPQDDVQGNAPTREAAWPRSRRAGGRNSRHRPPPTRPPSHEHARALHTTETSAASRGQARRNKLLVSWGPLVIAAPLAGSLPAPLRCAAPCQSQCRAISPPSRYPHLSQAAFAPSARSRCLFSVGARVSRS